MRILAPGRPWEGRAPGRVEPSPNRYPLGNPPPPRLLVPGPAPPRTPPPPSGRLNDGPADCGADGVAMRVWTAGAGRLWIDGAAPWEAVPAGSPSPLFAMVCKYTGRCAEADVRDHEGLMSGNLEAHLLQQENVALVDLARSAPLGICDVE